MPMPIRSPRDADRLIKQTRDRLLYDAGAACDAVATGVRTVLSLDEMRRQEAARAVLPELKKALDTAANRLRLFEGLLPKE